MRTHISALAITAALAATGCGPDCESTCNKLYQEAECNIQSPGWSREKLLENCNTECENALDKPGDPRETYQPHEYSPADESVTFTNDAEAAMWMDCVNEKACSLLDDGYCAPVW